MKQSLFPFLIVSCIFSILISYATSVSARSENDRRNSAKYRSAVERYLVRQGVVKRANVNMKRSIYNIGPGNNMHVNVDNEPSSFNGMPNSLSFQFQKLFPFSYPLVIPNANGPIENVTLPYNNASLSNSF